MKRFPISCIIVFFTIIFNCNNTLAQLYHANALAVVSATLRSDSLVLHNGERDANAFDPVLLVSKNPTTCNGSEGSIVFGGLTPNTSYQVSYDHDGVITGPLTIVSNAAGELSFTGLNKGSIVIFNSIPAAATHSCLTELFYRIRKSLLSSTPLHLFVKEPRRRFYRQHLPMPFPSPATGAPR